MSYFQTSFSTLCISILGIVFLPLNLTAQYSVPTQSYVGIEKVFPSFSLTRAELEESQVLTDLNERFESDWVKKYYSVTIETIHDGKVVTTQGKNETLTLEQKANLVAADPGAEFKVIVNYLPNNSLKVNEEKVLDFKCFVEPESPAKFGSELSIDQYLQSQIMSKMPNKTLEDYDLGAYRFIVNESGNIIEPTVFWSSGSEWLDALCIDVICEMPKWVPAQYESGLTHSEDKVLLVGNTENCMIHTLNLDDSEFALPYTKD